MLITNANLITWGSEHQILHGYSIYYQPFTELNAGNLPEHILFGFYESVITTIIGGEMLMKDRELLTLDERRDCCKSKRVFSEDLEEA